MLAYSALASSYDSLTEDVDYSSFLSFYKKVFSDSGTEINSVLDLGCGTGNLTLLLAQAGYDMIGVDAQPEMLSEAMSKLFSSSLSDRVLLLNQRMEDLDLYGTVDAAVSSLDCLNYVPTDSLDEVFRRLHLFIRPDGLLIFDVITPDRFKSLDGQIFCDENDSVFCIWRADFDVDLNCCRYTLDCFEKTGKSSYRRSTEEHVEYAHDPEELMKKLSDAGFDNIVVYGGMDFHKPSSSDTRLFYVCRR